MAMKIDYHEAFHIHIYATLITQTKYEVVVNVIKIKLGHMTTMESSHWTHHNLDSN
jgi:hypothetical protein